MTLAALKVYRPRGIYETFKRSLDGSNESYRAQRHPIQTTSGQNQAIAAGKVLSQRPDVNPNV